MKRLPNPSRVRWLASAVASSALVLVVCGHAACGETEAPAPAAGAAAAPAPAPAGAGPAHEAHEFAGSLKRAAELGGGVRPEDVLGPHASEADLFNPDKESVRPALGGRVIVHLEAHPANLNYVLENSAVVTFML